MKTGTAIVMLALLAIGCLGTAAEAQGDSAPAQPLKCDVALVLDNSGSMKSGDPEFLIRRVASDFLQGFSPESRVSVILFSNSSELVLPLTAVGSDTAKQSIEAALNRIHYDGKYSNLPSALERAVYELKQNRNEGTAQLVVFLTDGIIDTGRPAEDLRKREWLTENLAAEAEGLGIRFIGIALSEQADFELIQTLGHKTQGGYYRILRTEDIGKAFENLRDTIAMPWTSSSPAPPSTATADNTEAAPANPAPENPIVTASATAPESPSATGAETNTAQPVAPAPANEQQVPAAQPAAADVTPTSPPQPVATDATSASTAQPIPASAVPIVPDAVPASTPQIPPADTTPAPQVQSANMEPQQTATTPVNETVSAPQAQTPATESQPATTAARDTETREWSQMLPKRYIQAALALLVVIAAAALIVVFAVFFRRSTLAPAGEGGAVSMPLAFIEEIDDVTGTVRHPIKKPVITIGWSEGNDLQIPDSEHRVSSLHASIEFRNGDFVLVDKGSQNGTFVEGTRLKPRVPRPLCSGETFAITKRFRFKFVLQGIDDKGGTMEALTVADTDGQTSRSTAKASTDISDFLHLDDEP